MGTRHPANDETAAWRRRLVHLRGPGRRRATDAAPRPSAGGQLGRQRLLTALNRVISSSLDMDDVLQAIAKAAATLMGAEVASFWIADPDTKTLELRAFSDEAIGATQKFRRTAFGQGSAGWVALHRRPMVANDAFADGRVGGLDWYREHGLTSTYTIPVLADGVVVAVLSLNGKGPFRLDAYDHSLLDGLVAQAAAAIRNARLFAAEAAASEAARAADRAKGEFLAMMSHEVRTPLNGIIGCADLLLDAGLTDDQAELVRMIVASGDGLLAIVNDVLDFAKIDAGRLELEQIDFWPDQAIRRVVEIQRPVAEAKGLAFVVDLDPSAGIAAVGDPARLGQVVGNLVSNAIKFTPSGQVRVSARAEQHEGGVELMVAVEDSGIGIDPDVQARLFSAFVQADSSTTRRFGGTGLGLAICRQLVELMGGQIRVESAANRGSRFEFTVTLGRSRLVKLAPDRRRARDRTAAEVEPPNGPLRTERSDGPPRVLLVEDSPANQRIVALMGERQGLAIEVVADGLLAVEAAARRGPYAAILMDCRVPKLDGLEATRCIRALGGSLGTVPIIALTANAFAEDRRQCLEAGMNDVLAKPMTMDDFSAALRRWLPDLP